MPVAAAAGLAPPPSLNVILKQLQGMLDSLVTGMNLILKPASADALAAAAEDGKGLLESVRSPLIRLLSKDFPQECIPAAAAQIFSPSSRTNVLDLASDAIKSSSRDDKVQTAVREILYAILAEAIEACRARQTLSSYATRIKNTCRQAYLLETTARNKCLALEALERLLESYELVLPADFQSAPLGLLLYEQQTSIQPSVRGHVLITWGLLCRKARREFDAYEVRKLPRESLTEALVRTCIVALENQLADKPGKQELTIIDGALRGLTWAVTSSCRDQSTIENLFRFATLFMTPHSDLKRFAVPEHALDLLRTHAPLMRLQIMRDPMGLFTKIVAQANSEHKLLRQPGLEAACAVLEQIGFVLGGDDERSWSTEDDDAKQGEDGLLPGVVLSETEKRNWLVDFMTTLHRMSKDSDSGGKLVRNSFNIALFGFGTLASAVYKLFNEERLKSVLEALFAMAYEREAEADFAAVPSSGAGSMQWENLYDRTNRRVLFLTAYARVAQQMPSTIFSDEAVSARLEADVQELVELYAKTQAAQVRIRIAHCLNRFLAALCYHRDRNPSMAHGSQSQSQVEISAMPAALGSIVFRALMRSLDAIPDARDPDFTAYNRLDPDTNELRDQLFPDYVALWQQLLPRLHLEASREAASALPSAGPPFARALSTARAFTLAQVMQCSIKILAEQRLECYLEDSLDEQPDEDRGKAGPGSILTGPEQLVHSTERVLAVFPDDYRLAMNLAGLLSRVFAPNPRVIKSWAPLLASMLTDLSIRYPLASLVYKLMGLVFASLGTETIADAPLHATLVEFVDAAIARSRAYSDELQWSCLKCLLIAPVSLVKERLLAFQSVLSLALDVGLGVPDVAAAAMNALETWMGSLGQVIDVGPALVQYLSSPALASRAALLLGSVGGNRLALVRPQNALAVVEAWEPVPRLRLKIRFASGLEILVVDELLRRCTELALGAPEIKSTSLEVLHGLCSLVVVMEKDGDHDAVRQTLAKLSPILLRLAVDPAPMARDLFAPLVLQLARWFSSQRRPSAMVLLDAALDGLAVQDNGALREFAAKTVADFFAFAVRTPSSPMEDDDRALIVLRRLFGLAVDSDPFRRMGASLALKEIKAPFRNSAEMVNVFALELWAAMLTSLMLAHNDPPVLGTGAMALEVIKGVYRLIEQEHVVLDQPCIRRRGPFSELKNSLPWLLARCASPQTLFRQACQEGFRRVASKLGGASKIAMPDLDCDFLRRKTDSDFASEDFESVYGMIQAHWWFLEMGLVNIDQILGSGSEPSAEADETMGGSGSARKQARSETVLSLVERLCDWVMTTKTPSHARLVVQCLVEARKLYQRVGSRTELRGDGALISAMLYISLKPSLWSLDGSSKHTMPEALRAFVSGHPRRMALARNALVGFMKRFNRTDPKLGLSELGLPGGDNGDLLRGLRYLVRMGVDVCLTLAVTKAFFADLAFRQCAIPNATPMALQEAQSSLMLALELGWDGLESALLDPKAGPVVLMSFKDACAAHLSSSADPALLVSRLLGMWSEAGPSSDQAHALLCIVLPRLKLGAVYPSRVVLDERLSSSLVLLGLLAHCESAQPDCTQEWVDLLRALFDKNPSNAIRAQILETLLPYLARRDGGDTNASRVVNLILTRVIGHIFPINSASLKTASKLALADYETALEALLRALETSNVNPVILRLFYNTLREGDAHAMAATIRPRLEQLGARLVVNPFGRDVVGEVMRTFTPSDASLRGVALTLTMWLGRPLLARFSDLEWRQLLSAHNVSRLLTAIRNADDTERCAAACVVLEIMYVSLSKEAIRELVVGLPPGIVTPADKTPTGSELNGDLIKTLSAHLSKAGASSAASLDPLASVMGDSALALVANEDAQVRPWALSSKEKMLNVAMQSLSAIICKTQIKPEIINKHLFLGGKVDVLYALVPAITEELSFRLAVFASASEAKAAAEDAEEEADDGNGQKLSVALAPLQQPPPLPARRVTARIGASSQLLPFGLSSMAVADTAPSAEFAAPEVAMAMQPESLERNPLGAEAAPGDVIEALPLFAVLVKAVEAINAAEIDAKEYVNLMIAAMKDTRAGRAGMAVRLLALKVVIAKPALFPARVAEAVMSVITDLESPLVSKVLGMRQIVKDAIDTILALDPMGENCSRECLSEFCSLLIRLAAPMRLGKLKLISRPLALVMNVLERFASKLLSSFETTLQNVMSLNPVSTCLILARLCKGGYRPTSLVPFIHALRTHVDTVSLSSSTSSSASSAAAAAAAAAAAGSAGAPRSEDKFAVIFQAVAALARSCAADVADLPKLVDFLRTSLEDLTLPNADPTLAAKLPLLMGAACADEGPPTGLLSERLLKHVLVHLARFDDKALAAIARVFVHVDAPAQLRMSPGECYSYFPFVLLRLLRNQQASICEAGLDLAVTLASRAGLSSPEQGGHEWFAEFRRVAMSHTSDAVRTKALSISERLVRDLRWGEAKSLLALSAEDDEALRIWHGLLSSTSLADRLAECLNEIKPAFASEEERRKRHAMFEKSWPQVVARLLLRTCLDLPGFDRELLQDAPLVSNAGFAAFEFRSSARAPSTAALFSSQSRTGGAGSRWRQTSSANSQVLFSASQAMGMPGMVLATQSEARYAPTQDLMSGPGQFASAAQSGKSPMGRRFRAFRKGDVPDVQIPLKDIVVPWMELCQLDFETARTTLMCLIRIVSARLTQVQRDRIGVGLGTQLALATGGNAAFVSCLCSIAVELGVPVDQDAVWRACVASSTQASGALLLEARVAQGQDAASGRLQSLYAALSETDLLLGTVDDAHVRRALEAELMGDFVQAKKLLKDQVSRVAREALLRCDFATQDWAKVLQCPDAPAGMRLTAALRSEPAQAATIAEQVGVACADSALMRVVVPAHRDWALCENEALVALDAIIQRWCSLSPLAINSRLECIKPLAQIASLVDATGAQRSGSLAGILADGTGRWLWSAPDAATDALETWEAVETTRRLCLDALEAGDSLRVAKYKCNFLIKAATAAQRQNAFGISTTYLQQATRLVRKPGFEVLTSNVHQAMMDLILAEAQATGELRSIRKAVGDEALHMNKYGGTAWFFKAFAMMRRLIDAEERAKDLGYNGEHAVRAKEYLAKTLELAGPDNPEMSSAAYYQLGLLCAEVPEKPMASAAPEVVSNMLRALELGSSDAALFFPRLISLSTKSSEAMGAFERGIRVVPTSSFVQWAPQLLAVVDSGVQLRDCLIRLAKEQRWSLVFPFCVAKDALHLRELSVETEETLRILSRTLDADGVPEHFRKNIALLGNPLRRILDLLNLLRKNPSAKLWEAVRKEIIQEVFGRDPDSHKSLDEFAAMAGTHPIEFARTHWREFEPFLKNKSFSETNLAAFLARTKEISNAENKKASSSSSSSSTSRSSIASSDLQPLEECSRWMASFNGDVELMLPGPGNGTPQTVTGFAPRVKVLPSLRKPKRLDVRGRLGECMFLAKSGEDLRLDQRIEMLFARMNALWAADGPCAKRGLEIRTYVVVPLSLQTGLIEWVPDTRTLLSVMKDWLPKGTTFDAQHAMVYAAWENMGAHNGLSHALFEPSNAPDVEAMFERVCKVAPSTLLKQHAQHICPSPEALLQMRSAMARSFSALSIGGYVLGIGDRHLDNFLLAKGGELVPIDFGYSFGIGVSMLPVPELCPLRYTRNLRAFLEPVPGQRGQVHYSMLAAMRSLRDGRKRILDICEIFASEPLVDWSIAIKEKQDRQVLNMPKQMQVMNLKLSGARPVAVLSYELGQRSDGARYLAEVHRAAGSLGDDSLTPSVSVGEQIEQLLRLSEDTGIQARSYHGLKMWL